MLESQAQHIEALQRCDDVSPPYSLVADAQLMHCVGLGWAASSGFAQRRTLLFFFQLFTHSDIQTDFSCFALFRSCAQKMLVSWSSCGACKLLYGETLRCRRMAIPRSRRPACTPRLEHLRSRLGHARLLPIRADWHHPLSREKHFLFGTLWLDQTSAAALVRSLHTLR